MYFWCFIFVSLVAVLVVCHLSFVSPFLTPKTYAFSQTIAAPTIGAAPLVSSEPSLDIVNGNNNTPWAAVLGVFVAIIAFTWAMLALAL